MVNCVKWDNHTIKNSLRQDGFIPYIEAYGVSLGFMAKPDVRHVYLN